MKNHTDLKTDLITHHSSRITSGKHGFTLIELLLYMGLVAIFMTATVYFAWDVVLGNIKAGVHQEVQENLRFASHRIQVEIRNADSVDIDQSSFGINLAVNPGAMLSLIGVGSSYPMQFRVDQEEDQGTLQVRKGEEGWVSLTSSLVEVTELVFTNLGFEVRGCGSFQETAMECCFYQPGGHPTKAWVCDRSGFHKIDPTDCLGPAGGGLIQHKHFCKGALTYENIRFTLTIRHKNPSGRSEWEKEATFETSAQLR